MFTAFRKLITGSNSKPNFSGRFTIDEYYGQFYAPKSLNELDRILSSRVKKNMVSEEEITFNQVAFETTLRDTIKKLGPPMYRINKNKDLSGHEIIFYRFDFGDFRVTAQLHFLNKYFFLGQYFYNDLAFEKFAEIKSLLAQKYIPGNQVDLSNIRIVDAKNNRIEICDDSYGLIQYISGNKQFLERIRKDIALVKENALQLEKAKINTVYASL